MKYDYMNEAVDELCSAMVKNPERFSIGVHTMDDGKTGVEYWISGGGAITETWNGRSSNTVFSYEQGKRVREAFSEMREIKASNAQQKILNGVNKPNDSETVSKTYSPAIVIMIVVIVMVLFAIFHSLP
jgi:hypothetical protein